MIDFDGVADKASEEDSKYFSSICYSPIRIEDFITHESAVNAHTIINVASGGGAKNPGRGELMRLLSFHNLVMGCVKRRVDDRS